jgi:hypothetical protein
VTKPALKLVTVKPKVSPASVVEKIWIAGGVFGPITKGMGPEAKVIGLPSVKYVMKVPPIAPATAEVPGANVRVRGGVAVKESVPVAEKKPLMESACATATLLMARAKSIKRRFIIGSSPGVEESAVREVLSPEYQQVQSHLIGLKRSRLTL